MNTGSRFTLMTNTTVDDEESAAALIKLVFDELNTGAMTNGRPSAVCPDPETSIFSYGGFTVDQDDYTKVVYTTNALDMNACLQAYKAKTSSENNQFVANEATIWMAGEPEAALINVKTCFSKEKEDSKRDASEAPYCENGYKPGLMSISCSGAECSDADKELCCVKPDGGSRRRRDTGSHVRRDTGSRDRRAELANGTYFPLTKDEAVKVRTYARSTGSDTSNKYFQMPSLVLVPFSDETFVDANGNDFSEWEISPKVYSSLDVADSLQGEAGATMIANRLATFADVDGDGDMDVLFTKPMFMVDGMWYPHVLQLRRNGGDSAAGQCAELRSDMTSHNDICKPCADNDVNCV